MPRSLRITPGGYCYHVLNRGVGRMQLFDDEGDYLAFLRVLGEGLGRVPQARLLSYCMMPNHWHLVLWPRRGSDRCLSELMRWVGTTHSRRWHLHRHSVGEGPIYQGRFKSFPIQEDEHLLGVMRYVERNALRANLVNKAELWRWGSLWLRGQKTGGLEPEEQVMQGLVSDGPVARPRNWVARVNKPQAQKELDALRLCVKRGRPLGSEGWVEKTAAKMGLSGSLRGPGRPRKGA